MFLLGGRIIAGLESAGSSPGHYQGNTENSRIAANLKEHTLSAHVSSSDLFEAQSCLRRQMMHVHLGYKAPVMPLRSFLSDQDWVRAVDTLNEEQASLAAILAAVNIRVLTKPNARVWGAISLMFLYQGKRINVSQISLAKVAKGVWVNDKVCAAGAYPREMTAMIRILVKLGVVKLHAGNELWWGQGAVLEIDDFKKILLLNTLPEQRLGAESIDIGPVPWFELPTTAISTFDSTKTTTYNAAAVEEDEGAKVRGEEAVQERGLAELLLEWGVWPGGSTVAKSRVTKRARKLSEELGLRWRVSSTALGASRCSRSGVRNRYTQRVYWVGGSDEKVSRLGWLLKQSFPRQGMEFETPEWMWELITMLY